MIRGVRSGITAPGVSDHKQWDQNQEFPEGSEIRLYPFFVEYICRDQAADRKGRC